MDRVIIGIVFGNLQSGAVRVKTKSGVLERIIAKEEVES